MAFRDRGDRDAERDRDRDRQRARGERERGERDRPEEDPRHRREPQTRGSRPGLNSYWIDGRGINREVLQREICKYLGNDATSKPGDFNVRAVSALFVYALMKLCREFQDS